MMTEFTKKVYQTILQYDMLRHGETVVVGLSGGADSMALLAVLLELKDSLSLSVCAAHVNHGLRGGESDADECFVRDWCAANGVSLFVRRADVAALAKKAGVSQEVCGREVRYRFFEEVLRQAAAQKPDLRAETGRREQDIAPSGFGGAATPAGKIATAHTLSDRAETLLFQIARGSGGAGLCAIPPVRGKIIRPLYDRTRAEVEAFCAQKGIRFVTDSTNRLDRYSRNKIRNRVIPALREINPAFEAAAARLMRAAREDNDLLERLAKEEYDRRSVKRDAGVDADTDAGRETAALATAGFQTLPPALQHRVAKRFLEDCGLPVNAKFIEQTAQLAANGRGRFSVCGALFVEAADGRLAVRRGLHRAPSAPAQPEPVIFDETETAAAAGLCFRVASRAEFEKKQKVFKNFFFFALDYDRICGNVYIRTRRTGDRLTLPGRPGKTLKKWMIDEKIPVGRRETIRVLCDDAGILAVEGLGTDARCAVSAKTSRVLVGRAEPASKGEQK